jgi:hypothetical protein
MINEGTSKKFGRLLTLQEAAKTRAGLNRDSLRRACKAGKLAFTTEPKGNKERILVKQEDLDSFLAPNEVKAHCRSEQLVVTDKAQYPVAESKLISEANSKAIVVETNDLQSTGQSLITSIAESTTRPEREVQNRPKPRLKDEKALFRRLKNSMRGCNAMQFLNIQSWIVQRMEHMLSGKCSEGAAKADIPK